MAKSEPARLCADAAAVPQPRDRHWRSRFLDTLATSSNAASAAAAAGITLSHAYRLRRTDPEFARQWQVALADGYLHLELELVRRLREGDFKTADGEKFDFTNAIRLLASQRSCSSKSSAAVPERNVSAAEVRASIDRKIEDIRRRMVRQQEAEGSSE
jgi:broad specificity phosphatase PhoE